MQETLQKTKQSNDLAAQLQPQSFDDLLTFADRIVKSRLCPDHFEDASDVVLVAQQGVELGLDVMTALQNSHVIHGQVGWDADLLKALCLNTGEVDRWHYEEKSDERCAAVVKRKGMDAETFTWTKQRAKSAELWDKGVWNAHPATMLRHRVDAEAARAVFPDVVAGVHVPDELREAAGAHDQPNPVEAETIDAEHQEHDPTDVDQLEAELAGGGGDDESVGSQTDSDPDTSEESTSYVDDDIWEAECNRVKDLLEEASVSEKRAREVLQTLAEKQGVEGVAHIPPQQIADLVDEIEKTDTEPRSDGPPERSDWAAEYVADE